MNEYLDLIGTPWSEANCAGIARMAYERLGRPVSHEALPADTEAGRAAWAALGRAEAFWSKVGEDWRACDQPGRLVVCEGEDGGPHVGVVIAPHRVLSSCRLQGAYIAPAGRVARIIGVYEPRGEA